MSLLIRRLSYFIVQVHSKKRLSERDFELKLGANIHSPATERARWEAMSIRETIRAGSRIDG